MFNKIILMSALFVISATVSAETAKKSPKDIARLIDRLEACAHFSGEVGSEDKEHENEMKKNMQDYNCDHNALKNNIHTIRARYKDQSERLRPLEKSIAEIKETYAIEY